MRFSIIKLCFLAGLVTATSVVGCTGLKVGSMPAQESDGNAAERVQQMFEAAEIPVAVPLAEEWTYNTGGAFGPGAPLIFESFLATGARNGDVHVISVETGKKVGSHNYGEAIDGTPVRYGSYLIVPVSWGSKRGLVAHDMENGSTAWSLKMPPVDTGMLLVDDVLYVSDRESTVHAISPVDGATLWATSFDYRTPIRIGPVELSDDHIAVADGAGNVTAIDKQTGDTIWATKTEEPVFSEMIADGKVLYCTSTRGTVNALNVENGRIEWSVDIDSDDVRITAASLFDNRLVVGTSSGRVLVLNKKTAEIIWEANVVEAVASKPLVTRDYIFVSTMDRLVRALDRQTGEERWTIELKGRAKSAMTALDDQIFLLSEPRLVYKLVSTVEDIAHVE